MSSPVGRCKRCGAERPVFGVTAGDFVTGWIRCSVCSFQTPSGMSFAEARESWNASEDVAGQPLQPREPS